MPLPPDLDAPPRPRKTSVSEYFRMAETGVLSPGERVELIDGALYERSPQGDFHAAVTDAVNRLCNRLAGEPPRWIVRVQSTVRVRRYGAPDPDVTLLRPRDDFYAVGGPRPADVLLVIEVADSSLTKDRTLKAADYARAGIAEYWIINLRDPGVEVHRSPATRSGRYRAIHRATIGETLTLVLLPGVNVPVTDLLGPLAAAVPPAARRRPRSSSGTERGRRSRRPRLPGRGG